MKAIGLLTLVLATLNSMFAVANLLDGNLGVAIFNYITVVAAFSFVVFDHTEDELYFLDKQQ